MQNIPSVKLGIVAVSRDCFPITLSQRRRAEVVRCFAQAGGEIYEAKTTIENENDAIKALAEIRDAGVNALVVYLGNFGPEGPETLLAQSFLPLPVMFVAAAEEDTAVLTSDRGDAYCGMLNASYNIGLRGLKVYIPEYPVGTPAEVSAMIAEFIPVARTLIALRKLKKSFGDRVLFHDVDLQVRGGERIALIGDNGTGKSTLIKMLMEEEYPDEGKIKFGPSVRTAYLPQIVTFDVPERNLVDTMLYSKRNITPQTARDRLAAFHFTGEDVFKSVSVLSGGELSRLKLCILMDEEVNLLILDEPTNHLDIASREWIEEAVESYDGTLLFVSHDRYFINRFATRVWELENGVITDYPMGFARYRQVKALEAQNKIDHTPKAVKEKTITEKPKPNRSAQQARRQLTICEKEISAQEAAIAEIEQRLEEAGSDYERYSEIYKEKEAAEETLGALMEKWETLAEQAGE